MSPRREFDAPRADPDETSELEELEPDRAAGRFGELGVGKTDAPDSAQERIGERGVPEPQLVGAQGCGRGSVGEQVALAFLDPVLHLAAGAVDLLIEKAGARLGLVQRGDDEARIGLAVCPFRLGDDPAPARPAVERRIAEVLEAASGLAGRGRLRLGLQEFDADLFDQPRIAGEPEYEVHLVHLLHQAISTSRGEPGVGAQQDARSRPTPPNCATMRATSSTEPALASMFDGLSLAASRCRPQNT